MFVRRPISIALAFLAMLATVSAQGQATPPQSPSTPPAGQATPPQAAGPPLSMDDAVRLALVHNQTLIAQRLSVDISKADEITAGLKPNPNLALAFAGVPVAPSQFNATFFKDVAQYTAALSYTFERGGKRNERVLSAKDSTDVTAKSVVDAERQLRFQTIQDFINVQLAKSTLDLARQDLTSFSSTVETSQARVNAGDLAVGDFLQISLQKLQFEQDVSAAELSLIQSKATLRQELGYDTVADDFDVAGDLSHLKITVTLDALKQDALASRPDLQSAEASLKMASDDIDLAISNRARDINGNVNYSRNAIGPDSVLGVGVAFDLKVHDQNQGNIAHARIVVDQAKETEAATRATVLTDVVSAFAQYQTNDKVLTLFESGYLDQAKQSLDIATYVFQRGAGSLLDLLNAERTYRSTELSYRQALAAYVTSVFQINFVVGRQVVP
jgi:cobalt-zinc-cadmium efflux system outer membrane protein